MKKALALVLALVMVLSLAVSAFAITLVPLKKDSADPKKAVEYKDDFFSLNHDTEYWCCDPHGGVFYINLCRDGNKLENIEVATTGIVSAKVMEWNPETMVYIDKDGNEITDFNEYQVVRYIGSSKKVDETALTEKEIAAIGEGYNANDKTYKAIAAAVKALNKEFKTSKYQVKCTSYSYVIEITVAPNYSAAYKEGSFKVKAYDTVKKENLISDTYTVISDVSIFDYETVKWAATYHDDEEALNVYGDEGYSDYLTAKYGYMTPGLEVVEWMTWPKAHVISTTAFRAIQGKDLTVNVPCEYFTKLVVDIEDIAAGQKGVNFVAYNKGYVKADKAYEFGFYGDQVIASDYTITLNTGLSYFYFRELFGEKIEEDDVLTFYVLKDGKKFDEFTVDYMTANYNDIVEIEIDGKAGTNLGKYEITLAAPAAEKGEQNPNTGAESMIGVVAALAVVSVATAAAVSLKK